MSISHVQALLCPLPLDQTGFLPDSGVVMASSGSKDGPVLGSGGTGQQQLDVDGESDSGEPLVDWSGNNEQGEDCEAAGFEEGKTLAQQIHADSQLLPEPQGPSWR